MLTTELREIERAEFGGGLDLDQRARRAEGALEHLVEQLEGWDLLAEPITEGEIERAFQEAGL